MPTEINKPVTPPTEELRKIFKNPRVLKAFEQLFEAVPSDLNTLLDMLESVEMEAGAAGAKAVQALGMVSVLKRLAEQAALAPAPIHPESILDQQLSPLAPPPFVPYGATGTFTTSDPYTVTVVNGIITDIS
jgi:hypothetical protein